MPQKPTPKPDSKPVLPTPQLTALEHLLAGDTVTAAAEAAAVDRSTVHRWLRHDWDFQPALNRGRRDLYEATRGRLAAAACKAADNLAAAISGGDLSSSVLILKGLGVLSGQYPPLGTEDADVLQRDAELAQTQAAADRYQRETDALYRNPLGVR